MIVQMNVEAMGSKRETAVTRFPSVSSYTTASVPIGEIRSEMRKLIQHRISDRLDAQCEEIRAHARGRTTQEKFVEVLNSLETEIVGQIDLYLQRYQHKQEFQRSTDVRHFEEKYFKGKLLYKVIEVNADLHPINFKLSTNPRSNYKPFYGAVESSAERRKNGVTFRDGDNDVFEEERPRIEPQNPPHRRSIEDTHRDERSQGPPSRELSNNSLAMTNISTFQPRIFRASTMRSQKTDHPVESDPSLRKRPEPRRNIPANEEEQNLTSYAERVQRNLFPNDVYVSQRKFSSTQINNRAATPFEPTRSLINPRPPRETPSRTTSQSVVENNYNQDSRLNYTEVVESFDKASYYSELPEPWNEYPDTMEQVDKVHKRIDRLLPRSFDKNQTICFTGNGYEYFAWRREFIAWVHSQNIKVVDKMTHLKKLLGKGFNPYLDGAVRAAGPNKESYKSIIAILETNYGGETRAKQIAEKLLMYKPKVKVNDYHSVVQAFSTIDNFFNFCETNGLKNYFHQESTITKAYNAFCDVDTEMYIEQYIRVHADQFFNLPSRSVETLWNFFNVRSRQMSQMRAAKGHIETAGGVRSRDQGQRPYQTNPYRTRYQDRHKAFLAEQVEDADDHDDVEQGASDPEGELDGEVDNSEIYITEEIASTENDFVFFVEQGKKLKPCDLCKGSHLLLMCPKYKSLSGKARKYHLSKAKRCYICLSPYHSESKKCTNKEVRCTQAGCDQKLPHHPSICEKYASRWKVVKPIKSDKSSDVKISVVETKEKKKSEPKKFDYRNNFLKANKPKGDKSKSKLTTAAAVCDDEVDGDEYCDDEYEYDVEADEFQSEDEAESD